MAQFVNWTVYGSRELNFQWVSSVAVVMTWLFHLEWDVLYFYILLEIFEFILKFFIGRGCWFSYLLITYIWVNRKLSMKEDFSGHVREQEGIGTGNIRNRLKDCVFEISTLYFSFDVFNSTIVYWNAYCSTRFITSVYNTYGLMLELHYWTHVVFTWLSRWIQACWNINSWFGINENLYYCMAYFYIFKILFLTDNE